MADSQDKPMDVVKGNCGGTMTPELLGLTQVAVDVRLQIEDVVAIGVSEIVDGVRAQLEELDPVIEDMHRQSIDLARRLEAECGRERQELETAVVAKARKTLADCGLSTRRLEFSANTHTKDGVIAGSVVACERYHGEDSSVEPDKLDIRVSGKLSWVVETRPISELHRTLVEENAKLSGHLDKLRRQRLELQAVISPAKIAEFERTMRAQIASGRIRQTGAAGVQILDGLRDSAEKKLKSLHDKSVKLLGQIGVSTPPKPEK